MKDCNRKYTDNNNNLMIVKAVAKAILAAIIIPARV